MIYEIFGYAMSANDKETIIDEELTTSLVGGVMNAVR